MAESIKQTRVSEIAKELARGERRIDIVRKFTKKYKLKESAIDKLIKIAKVEAEKLIEIKRNTTNNTIIAETEQAVKNGLKTDFEIEMQLQKIAFGEMDVIETIDTPNGVSTRKRKPNPAEMKQAAELILKKRGSLIEKRDISVNQPMIINWNGSEEQK